MTDVPGTDAGIDPEDDSPGIGVGMGGSCPECRAPVQLGQEFCLECGSPIRFTARPRKKGGAGRTQVAAATPVSKGFPWVPFLVVLVLVLGGLAFALTSGGDSDSKDGARDTTEAALPQITNSTPTATTPTETVASCPDPAGLDGTEPAVDDSAADGFVGTETGSDAQVPDIASDGSDTQSNDPAAPTPETTEDPSGADGDDAGTTVTVDEDGTFCDATEGDDPFAEAPADDGSQLPTTPGSSTTDTTGTTSTTPVNDDSWPSGRSGWTVIVNGDAGAEANANRIAQDLQAKQLEGGVLKSDDYVSLCPGNWVVFSGVHTTEAAATAHRTKVVAAGFRQAYVREVRTTGSKPSCVSSGTRP